MESPLCPPADPAFRLIETFLWEPDRGIRRRDLHLARLMRSAARLGITPENIPHVLEGLSGDQALRVRLTVDAAGRAEVTSAPFTPMPDGAIWRVAWADQRVRSSDPWLQVKTTERQVYDAARASLPDGVDELLFLNERGELCEGTITNLFAQMQDKLLTPPLISGVLPGVLRQEMIDNGDAFEALLTQDSLRDARTIYMGNSLRGLIPAQLV